MAAVTNRTERTVLGSCPLPQPIRLQQSTQSQFNTILDTTPPTATHLAYLTRSSYSTLFTFSMHYKSITYVHAEAAHHVETTRHFFALQLKSYYRAGGPIEYNLLIDLNTVILAKDVQR